MVEVNRLTTPANMRWKLVDRDTGAANHAIDWQFTVGDRVKLRLVNEMDSDHPMHHPFHVHGAGRFVVLARDGVPEAEPRLEGHRPRPHRRDGRHPARRHQPRTLDGALPHRRAPRERDDVQLRRRARCRVLRLRPLRWPEAPRRRGRCRANRGARRPVPGGPSRFRGHLRRHARRGSLPPRLPVVRQPLR